MLILVARADIGQIKERLALQYDGSMLVRHKTMERWHGVKYAVVDIIRRRHNYGIGRLWLRYGKVS